MNTGPISCGEGPRVTSSPHPGVGVEVLEVWSRSSLPLSRSTIREPLPLFTPAAVVKSPHQLLDFAGQNTPSGPIFRSSSALKSRGPTAIWVGIPKDTGCWESWRGFLDFLNNGILEQDGLDEDYPLTAPNPVSRGWLSTIINIIGQWGM